MAESGVTWDMAALHAAFVRLTDDLKAEVQSELAATAESVTSTVSSAYPAVTGNLQRGVRTQHGEAGSRVRTTAAHAHIYEFGTRPRFDSTRKNANRGVMPAGKVFIPAAMRARSAMLGRLQAMLDRPREVV